MTADFEPISVDLAREPDFSVGALSVRPSLREVESRRAFTSETIPRVGYRLVAASGAGVVHAGETRRASAADAGATPMLSG